MSATATPDTALPRLPAIVVGRVTHQRRGPVQARVPASGLPVARRPRLLHVPEHLRDVRRLRQRRTISATLASRSRTTSRTTWRCNGISLGDRRPGRHARRAPASWATSSTRCRCSGVTTAAGGSLPLVAEVHNTYGERHAYLLHPDEPGFRRHAARTFHVSPFFDVSGSYELRFTLRPDQRIDIRRAAPRWCRRVRRGVSGSARASHSPRRRLGSSTPAPDDPAGFHADPVARHLAVAPRAACTRANSTSDRQGSNRGTERQGRLGRRRI